MNRIEHLIAAMEMNRTRTLGLLDKIAQTVNPQAILGFRPGVGRAHIAWQLMHLAITEELFATSRLFPEKTPRYAELIPRFQGGSTPDDDIPACDDIRRMLAESRTNLLDTLRRFSDDRLGEIPEAFKARNLTLLDVLHIIVWHEPHHQGQAHLTLNLALAASST